MKAFVTLVSSQDYILGALVLNKSLQGVNSKYPLVVVLTEDLATQSNLNLFSKENIIVETVSTLTYGEATAKEIERRKWPIKVLNTASKFHIFNLKKYEKLVYIDCDTMFLKNSDELFDYPDGSMMYIKGEEWGMTGCIVFCPKNHNYELYLKLLDFQTRVDGGILGDLFFPVKSNPDYQIDSDIYLTDISQLTSRTKIVHFGYQARKPFHYNVDEMAEKLDVAFPYRLYFYYMIPLKEKHNL